MKTERMNILLIMTDQQRYDSLGCDGSSFVFTPTIDRIATDGILFDRTYCTNPICTPSRVSIFTGMYPGGHGVWHNGMYANRPDAFISDLLRRQEYSTWYIGKAHFNPWTAPAGESPESFMQGWERYMADFKLPYYGFENCELSIGHTSFGHYGHYGLWLKEKLGGSPNFAFRRRGSSVFGCEAIDWDIPVELHNNAWVAERSIHALHRAKAVNKPFFMTVSFQDPHHPHCLPTALAKKIRLENIPPPRYTVGELEDKPPHFMLAHEGKAQYPDKTKYRKPDEYTHAFRDVVNEDAILAKAYYYAMVEFIDYSLKSLMDELDALGMTDNTLVIFTSDHGEMLGDHGLWKKGPFHYEQLVHIPLIIKPPCFKRASAKYNGIVSLADIAPTILETAGIAIPEYMDGRSLCPIWNGNEIISRDCVFIEYVDNPKGLRLKTVVTERYKLTIYHGQPYGELYDLETDPLEMVNRFYDSDATDVRLSLTAMLFDEMEKTEMKIRGKRVSSS